jgi:hypothetical protein
MQELKCALALSATCGNSFIDVDGEQVCRDCVTKVVRCELDKKTISIGKGVSHKLPDTEKCPFVQEECFELLEEVVPDHLITWARERNCSVEVRVKAVHYKVPSGAASLYLGGERTDSIPEGGCYLDLPVLRSNSGWITVQKQRASKSLEASWIVINTGHSIDLSVKSRHGSSFSVAKDEMVELCSGDRMILCTPGDKEITVLYRCPSQEREIEIISNVWDSYNYREHERVDEQLIRRMAVLGSFMERVDFEKGFSRWPQLQQLVKNVKLGMELQKFLEIAMVLQKKDSNDFASLCVAVSRTYRKDFVCDPILRDAVRLGLQWLAHDGIYMQHESKKAILNEIYENCPVQLAEKD